MHIGKQLKKIRDPFQPYSWIFSAESDYCDCFCYEYLHIVKDFDILFLLLHKYVYKMFAGNVQCTTEGVTLSGVPPDSPKGYPKKGWGL